MATTLGQVLTAARNRSPWFHKTRAPDVVVADELSTYQKRLISRISDHNPEAYAQQASVVFALSADNTPGAVGAGTTGGLPARLVGGAPKQVEEPAGAAAELDFSAPIYLTQPAVVGGAATVSVTVTGAGWTVNAFVGKTAWITDGPGIDQRRTILSNTADTLVISTGSDGQAWGTVPVIGQSLLAVVDVAPAITEEVGVVTAQPARGARHGYLVRLDANGTPYLDLARPIVAQFGVGITLPPHEALLGGAIIFTTADGRDPPDFTLLRYSQRWSSGANGYAGYLLNNQLYLIGDARTWAQVASIDLRYVPVPPPFTALTDYFLLRDDAYDVLVARAALFMGRRVAALPDIPQGAIDLVDLKAEFGDAEGQYMNSVTRLARRFPKETRAVW